MALISAGESPNSSAIQNARTYLNSMQGANAGFESFGTENSNTTAWAIMALKYLNESPKDSFWLVDGNSSDDFLLSLQDASGGFKWIDSSVYKLLEQLIPASANFSSEVNTIIENHVLSRNKYWN